MALERVVSLGYGGGFLNDKLPKVIAELQGLTISGPHAGAAADAALELIEAPERTDTLLKVLMFDTGVPSDITARTTIIDGRATGTLTLTDVVATNTAVVNGKTYTAVTFAANPTNAQVGPYNFAVGADDTATAENLAAAINSADSTHVSAAADTGVVTVTYASAGPDGNAIPLVGSTNIVASGANLAGGTSAKGVTVSVDTTGNTVLVFWYKKSRVVGQA